MGKNILSARMIFLLFLSTFVFYLPAKAQNRQAFVTYHDEKSAQFKLAQYESGLGGGLQPPVVSIEACTGVANTDPNTPGNPRCVNRGGLGGSGFWMSEAWILIHFKGLTMGRHKLYVYPSGTTREGNLKTFKRGEMLIENNKTGWWHWFRSPLIVGKHCLPCYLAFALDFPENLVGSIFYSGSFE